MLYGGVDARDVASANLAALRRLEAPAEFAAYNIFSALPFDDGDLEDLRTRPMVAVERHWPDAPRLLAAIGAKPWGPINTVYDIGRAARELAWRPRFGFAQFVEGLKRGVGSADELDPERTIAEGG
jgi:nucleoside-diphosphate-sugar epimerase